MARKIRLVTDWYVRGVMARQSSESTGLDVGPEHITSNMVARRKEHRSFPKEYYKPAEKVALGLVGSRAPKMYVKEQVDAHFDWLPYHPSLRTVKRWRREFG